MFTEFIKICFHWQITIRSREEPHGMGSSNYMHYILGILKYTLCFIDNPRMEKLLITIFDEIESHLFIPSV